MMDLINVKHNLQLLNFKKQVNMKKLDFIEVNEDMRKGIPLGNFAKSYIVTLGGKGKTYVPFTQYKTSERTKR